MNTFYRFATILLITIYQLPLVGQCFDDGHSPFENQGWKSCQISESPIPERGEAHWIMYNFGEPYAIDSLYFWNHNVWGETGMGVKEILIDYSLDMQNWTTVGPLEISRATGSWRYKGTQGPSLNNAKMQYVLFTVLSTWDEDMSCTGIGEVRFQIGESTTTEDPQAYDLSIMPNPASDNIMITIPEHMEPILNIGIINAVGQRVAKLPNPHGTTMIYPVRDLLNGYYYLSVYTKEGVHTIPFVKSGS